MLQPHSAKAYIYITQDLKGNDIYVCNITAISASFSGVFKKGAFASGWHKKSSNTICISNESSFLAVVNPAVPVCKIYRNSIEECLKAINAYFDISSFEIVQQSEAVINAKDFIAF